LAQAILAQAAGAVGRALGNSGRAMAALSEGEVAIYDRQLRLWGVQAQQRLLKARCLIWGIEGSNVEVAKNLVLAGVSMVVRDHKTVSAADVAYNYFLRPEDIGKNRADCAAARLQEMNPLCQVKACSKSPTIVEASPAEAIKDFDVVCCALGVLEWKVDRAKAVDDACRKMKATFLLSISTGEVAFFFANLHEHTVQERSGAQGGAGTTAATGEEAKSKEAEVVSYPSFGEFLACTPAQLQQQKADATFILVWLFVAFLKGGGKAAPEGAGDFATYCRDTAKCVPQLDGGPDLEDAFRCFFLEPLIHVASVLGGLQAQEVIKAITFRDPPMANCVCFNANTSVAMVERIPAAAPKKRKAAAMEEVADLLD